MTTAYFSYRRIHLFVGIYFPGVKTSLMAIDERLELLKGQHTDECESALEALGEIGSCKSVFPCGQVV